MRVCVRASSASPSHSVHAGEWMYAPAYLAEANAKVLKSRFMIEHYGKQRCRTFSRAVECIKVVRPLWHADWCMVLNTYLTHAYKIESNENICVTGERRRDRIPPSKRNGTDDDMPTHTVELLDVTPTTCHVLEYFGDFVFDANWMCAFFSFQLPYGAEQEVDRTHIAHNHMGDASVSFRTCCNLWNFHW